MPHGHVAAVHALARELGLPALLGPAGPQQGRARDYSSAYLRRTYREAGAVKNETVANISALPDHVIDLIDAGLKGQQLVPAGEAVTITRSVPHGQATPGHDRRS